MIWTCNLHVAHSESLEKFLKLNKLTLSTKIQLHDSTLQEDFELPDIRLVRNNTLDAIIAVTHKSKGFLDSILVGKDHPLCGFLDVHQTNI